ncbi:MAG TPA: hypothetical protein VF701_15935 [Thermoanaerobaculia bacterium]
MRGRVTVVLLFLLSLSPGLDAACDYTPRFSGQLRTTAYDVSLDSEGFVWLATGYGVTLLEMTGGSPLILDSIALPGSTRVVEASSNGIGYAGSGSSLHVVKREGKKLRLVRSIATGGTVNDIAIESYLFVATSSGIEHRALFDPENPTKTTVTLFTTSPNVTSLALGSSTLYAADGDASVEVYSIAFPSIPQRTGTLEAMPLASWVHTAPNGLIFVSDRFGQNTDIFIGANRVASMQSGTRSFAASASQTHYVASGRTLRAIDISALSRPVTRFSSQLAPSEGNENTIHAMARAGDTLFVAAGDIGLVVFDMSPMKAPFALASYSGAATSSVRIAGDKAWFADADGTIREQRIVSSGVALTELRSWSGGDGALVHDVEGETLLTSAGQNATLWSLGANPPVAAVTASFGDRVIEAVIRNGGMVVLLANGSLWAAAPSPQQIESPAVAHLARAGSALATAELRPDGTTLVRHYPDGDPSKSPATFSIAGLATGNLALDATRAALFTFSGITVIDLADGQKRTVPASDRTIPRQLVFSGPDLLAIDSTTLYVYANAQELTRGYPIPAEVVAMDAEPSVAAIATAGGNAAVSYVATNPEVSIPFRNSYYSKAAASDDQLYLFSRETIDFYSIAAADAPSYVAGVTAQGIIDIAATPAGLVTLAANGTVSLYSRAGVLLRSAVIAEAGVAVTSIAAVGDSIWLSLSKGCASGVCSSETRVLDPGTLAVISTMSGAVDDVANSGNRAWALVSFPDELRAIDISDPLHPVPLVTIPRPAFASSITYATGAVYVLAQRLHEYTATTLNPVTERLAPIANPPAQLIRAMADCVIVTGRSDQPELYSLPGWSAIQSAPSIPSTARSLILQDGRVVILTDHSIEVWSSLPPRTPGRTRSVR